ncbi:MAG: hypothetical protein HW421_918 [Ignavibacteria bacterium]|nr:hypothetical protein [Ignavibacteria bacterium]
MKNLKYFYCFKYVPFITSLLYLLFFLFLYYGSIRQFGWCISSDNPNWLNYFYNYCLIYSIEYHFIFYYLPLFLFIIFGLLRLIKIKIFLYYITLILLFIYILLCNFLWGYWNPY